jgi:putative DNA primase/helicase
VGLRGLPDGGDVIKLVEKVQGLKFKEAVEWLQARSSGIEPHEVGREDSVKKQQLHWQSQKEERGKLFALWHKKSCAAKGTPVEDYLLRRHVGLPPSANVRAVFDYPMWTRSGSRPQVVSRGPVMLAAITDQSDEVTGLHITYLDLKESGGKARIIDPQSGEELPAKKVRGVKLHGRIELARRAAPKRLVVGEGIETVLSVWCAIGDDADTAFWSAIDLGNLAGRAKSSVLVPQEYAKGAASLRCPGPFPDLDSLALAIPQSVTDLILLGDGDSDPFRTQCALFRAASRYEGPNRKVSVAWAPPGQDFNDLAPDWARIRAILDGARPPVMPLMASSAEPASAKTNQPDSPDRIDSAAIEEASALDHSDTDNARRLDLYYGHDLAVMAQTGERGGDWLAWNGRHWDWDGGDAAAIVIAKRVGDVIKTEAEMLKLTQAERQAIQSAAVAEPKLIAIDPIGGEGSDRAELVKAVAAGRAASRDLNSRRNERRKWGVTSKNAKNIENMLRLLAPAKRRAPDEFNSDHRLLATRTHTLRFNSSMGATPARVEAIREHCRQHMITAMVPVNYDPAAVCPKFLENMQRFQPDPAQRRTIQQFTGLGLLGLPIQRVMYHYGIGGNFKSVYLEVISRTMGDGIAAGLPAESISGRDERRAGQASPDLARIFGKRMLRVSELPDGQPLQASMIKRLTGGEKWPVRTLFKGYFEFQPHAKTHMSGNSLPHFDGSDGGMRRRLLIAEWPITIPETEQRDFEEVVRDLLTEKQGILNWLIQGATDYLQNGLVIADRMTKLTQEHMDEMDPIRQFYHVCVRRDPDGSGVPARAMYSAYCAWSDANAKRSRSETKFGRELKKLCSRDDSGSARIYVGVRLHGVPTARPSKAIEENAEQSQRIVGDDDPII